MLWMVVHMADRRAVRLRSASDVRRLLAATTNELRNGKVDPNVASKIGYLASILLKAIESDTVEARLQKLEQLVESKGIEHGRY